MLFNIYIDDTLNKLSEDTIAYADDIADIVEANNIDEFRNKFH